MYQYAFFLFPLVQLLTVFHDRNAATLVPHLVLAVTVNGFIWSIFGLTLQDWFVAGPNIAATIVGAIQLVCIVVFGRRTSQSGDRPRPNKRSSSAGSTSRRRRGDGYQSINTEDEEEQQQQDDDDDAPGPAGSSSRA